jgi:uncharacterized protein (DUF2141 family)
MKKIILILLSLHIYATFSATLDLKVQGIANNRGVVQVAVWSSEEGFPENYKRAVALKTVSLDSLKSIIFEEMAAGEYAVAIYHDENEDTILNTSGFGIPKEGFGFSNNPRIRFGPPKFKKAKFSLAQNQRYQATINLNYP